MTHKYADIVVINFEIFEKQKSWPRNPECSQLVTKLKDIDKSESLIVFISHKWVRGHPSNTGYDAIVGPHPDDPENTKHTLIVEGIRRMLKMFVKSTCKMKCYLWSDYSCINQDRNPGAEIGQLPVVVGKSDLIFTPIPDSGESWSLPKQYIDGYDQILSKQFTDGKFSYKNSAWCRLEMVAAANVPFDKKEDIDKLRISKFQNGLKVQHSRGCRPHLIYTNVLNGIGPDGSRRSPLIIPPMTDFYLDKHRPSDGYCRDEDKDRIREMEIKMIVLRRREHYKHKEGYYTGRVYQGLMHGFGELITDRNHHYKGEFKMDKKDGHGVFEFSDGATYCGTFQDDLMHGHATTTYPDGSMYEGCYNLGVRTGDGTFRGIDGGEQKGIFKDSIFVNGDIKYPDGGSYHGMAHGWHPHGKGRRVMSDGKVLEGYFDMGKLVRSKPQNVDMKVGFNTSSVNTIHTESIHETDNQRKRKL
jgi:hypothetical protein